MSREPSTLFAPGPLLGEGSVELLPMPPDIQAIYLAGQRNRPFNAELDDALAAHRQVFGEPEQLQHAQRVDPCDAMPIDPDARRQAYLRQRRYAVCAGMDAGMAPAAIAQALGISPGDI